MVQEKILKKMCCIEMKKYVKYCVSFISYLCLSSTGILYTMFIKG